jgi:hypothetical protein
LKTSVPFSRVTVKGGTFVRRFTKATDGVSSQPAAPAGCTSMRMMDAVSTEKRARPCVTTAAASATPEKPSSHLRAGALAEADATAASATSARSAALRGGAGAIAACAGVVARRRRRRAAAGVARARSFRF